MTTTTNTLYPPPTKEAVLAAERVLGFLMANPESWNQHIWAVSSEAEQRPNGAWYDPFTEGQENQMLVEASCGSAGCFCGWLTGDQKVPVFHDGTVFNMYVALDHGVESIDKWGGRFMGMGPKYEEEYEDGPTYDDRMFYSYNSIEKLAQWVRAVRHAYYNQITTSDAFGLLFPDDTGRTAVTYDV